MDFIIVELSRFASYEITCYCLINSFLYSFCKRYSNNGLRAQGGCARHFLLDNKYRKVSTANRPNGELSCKRSVQYAFVCTGAVKNNSGLWNLAEASLKEGKYFYAILGTQRLPIKWVATTGFLFLLEKYIRRRLTNLVKQILQYLHYTIQVKQFYAVVVYCCSTGLCV